MPDNVKVSDIDQHVKFLQEQAERLEQLGEERSYRWAEVNARQMRDIVKTLLEVRRDLQMTTLSGKRME